MGNSIKKILNPNKYFNDTNNKFYDFTIAPGTRFFFFKSLIEKAQVSKGAARVLNRAYDVINFNGKNSNTNENDFLAATQASIQLLYNLYQFELNNEINLFNEKIVPLLNDEYSEYKDCYTTNKVDYTKFMTLLKKLEADEHEAFQLLKNMQTTMHNFNNNANEYIEYNNILSETEILQQRRDIVINGRQTNKKTISHLANSMADALNDYVTRNDLSDISQKSYDFIRQNVISMLLSNQTVRQLSITEENALISNLFSKLKAIATETKKKDDDTYEQLIVNLKQVLEEIEKDQDKKTQIINQLLNYSKQLINAGDLLQVQGLQMERLINRLTSSAFTQAQDRIFGFNKNIRKKISQLNPEDKELKNLINNPIIHIKDEKGNIIAHEKFNILKKEHLQFYIRHLKNAFAPDEDISTDELIKKIDTLLKSHKQRKEILTIQTEGRSANFLSFLSDAVVSHLDGWLNGKNDATFYTYGKALYDRNKLSPATIKTIDDALTTILEQTDTQFNQRYTILLQQNNRKSNSFNARLQLQAVNDSEDTTLSQIQQELQKHQLKLHSARDIFQIDSSVKFAETFINKEGFHGGSLGADVEEQIDNINFMLETGGITPIDARFLLSAVLNAGEGMIGANQRPALENYFSTIASMLMFRTGGKLIEQWYLQAKTGYKVGTSKIHIYTFNTVYVPESFLLLKTYEALNKCNNLLTESLSNNGSKAFIYNPVSEADKVMINFYSQTKETDLIIPSWEETSKENYPKVKIEMALMGGFLDMLDDIIKNFNSSMS